ncbi:wHTH domain-containing protein [Nonomuraea guangzhouensis]|uniref:ATP-binding protein n=1 Tax=Nonomuraea guangzhouensis TaxID=1291555 RepID=A0ABW4GDP9_9ACTN|nr:hypothetical protein [Nonomuraea guangzhouensis]
MAQEKDNRNVVENCTVEGSVVQVGTAAQLSVYFSGSNPDSGAETRDSWISLVLESDVWQHVSSGRDATHHRQQVVEIVSSLVHLRDKAERQLISDQWQDPGIVPRFLERIEWLLDEPDRGSSVDFYPAEAALLVILPCLYRVQSLRLAARYSKIDPSKLNRMPEASIERQDFETFVEGYDLLVQRALRRPKVEETVGWWLFHRWLIGLEESSYQTSVQELYDVLQIGNALKEIVKPDTLSKLLHGLRRGPDVCNPEYLSTLQSDERLRGNQRIREQRLALIIALAYGTTIEMASLPEVVVEHLGIPYSVDLAQLRHTVEQANWGGSRDLPVLRAECHHEAVIEALNEYTVRVDELLHAVHRTVRERINQPMPALPTRLSSHGVVPAEGVFDGWASFRLDERRIRDVLMGVELYKDSDMAVRELYQNALDACRYRRARTEYLDRTEDASYAYTGQIVFRQGLDEDGRHFLECCDNGIGMGDAELRGVFSSAGARFAEQPDFKLEVSRWNRLEPPVALFPNSRFGIGVLSYFMLADEIRVTTCRMSPAGTLGPLLRVSIFGPGNLFRIGTLTEKGSESGTKVRLYLKNLPDNDTDWSCVDVLKRLLGIAEFSTIVQHGDRQESWEPGQLYLRKQPSKERFGLNTYGRQTVWTGAPPGTQVIWCEEGGAILVDGLVVQPAIRRGVLSSTQSGLTGAVVNLSCAYAPERLSADRSQILNDISGQVRGLLAEATQALLVDSPLDFEWISRIAEGSVQLSDIITNAAIKKGHCIKFRDREIDIRIAGCLPGDASIVPPSNNKGRTNKGQPSWASIIGNVPDYILLWRLLAHRPNRTLSVLAEICPTINNVGCTLAAIPSDQLLLASRSEDSKYWHWHRGLASSITDGLAEVAERLEVSLQSSAERAAALGLHPFHPTGFSDSCTISRADLEILQGSGGRFVGEGESPTVQDLLLAESRTSLDIQEIVPRWRSLGIDVPESIVTVAINADDVLLMRNLGEGHSTWLDPTEVVPPGHIAQSALKLGLPVDEVCSRLVRYGLRISSEQALASSLSDATLKLLSRGLDGCWPWLSPEDQVPPGFILAAAQELGLTPGAILDELHMFGFSAPAALPAELRFDDLPLLQDGDEEFLQPPGPISYMHLLKKSADLNLPLCEFVDRLREYGFEILPHFPSELTALDEELLDVDGPCDWWSLSTADIMPFARLVIAARSLHRSPEELASRLMSFGIDTSCNKLPENLSFRDSVELLIDNEAGEEAFLYYRDKFSIQELLELSRKMRTTIPQVTIWLRELGVRVPDVEETIRAALARVPLAPLPESD